MTSLLPGVLGFALGLCSMLLMWLHMRINKVSDSKLSKDVFEEFKKGFDEYKRLSEHRLEEYEKNASHQTKILEDIYKELKNKQDKTSP